MSNIASPEKMDNPSNFFKQNRSKSEQVSIKSSINQHLLDSPDLHNKLQKLQKKRLQEQQQLKWYNLENIVQIGLLVTLITIVITVIVKRDKVYDWFENFVLEIQVRPYEMAGVVVILFIICTIILIPPLLVQISSGYAYFQALDSVALTLSIVTTACFIGALIGGTCAMLLGRYIFRRRVKSQIKKYPIMRGIDKTIKLEGLQIVFLLRLCPIIPFMFFNYFLGITGLKVKHFNIAMIGMIPEFMMCIYIGLTLTNIEEIFEGKHKNKSEMYMIILGCIVAVCVIVYVTRLTKKHIKEHIEKQLEKDDLESIISVIELESFSIK